MIAGLISGVGWAVVLLGLLDMSLTVLIARIGTSILSGRIVAGTWRVFRLVGRHAGRFRLAILAAAGPAGIVLMVTVWIVLLIVGFALIMRPNVGRLITSSNSTPPQNMTTAVYASGAVLTTAGSGDLAPRTQAARRLWVLMSAVGLSTFTLMLTYLIQIYNALLQRNALVISLHFATANTGDAAEWIARLGASGDFSGACGELSETTNALSEVFEAHHFYPSLMYFRFYEDHYAMARGGLILLEAVTLIRSALDNEAYAHFKRCSGVESLWSACTFLLNELAPAYLPDKATQAPESPDEQKLARWQARFGRAMQCLRQAGIKVASDEAAAARRYVSLRNQWDSQLVAFGEYMDHEWVHIAPSDFS